MKSVFGLLFTRIDIALRFGGVRLNVRDDIEVRKIIVGADRNLDPFAIVGYSRAVVLIDRKLANKTVALHSELIQRKGSRLLGSTLRAYGVARGKSFLQCVGCLRVYRKQQTVVIENILSAPALEMSPLQPLRGCLAENPGSSIVRRP
jgi:hypothetical protein